MKKLKFVLFALCLAQLTWAQTALKGTVTDATTNKAIANATITLANQNITTQSNQAGEFSLLYLEAIDEEVIIEAAGYVSTIELVQLAEGTTTQMPPVALQQDIATEAKEEVLLNLTENELNDDEGKSQSQASASSASQDVFNSTTSWAWSTARYRSRGYEQTFEQNYINGISFNSAERGQFNFSAMGGLNDATRYKEVVNPIEATNFTFGGLGNATNYLQSATRYAQGWKVGVAGTNRNYKARANITYSSGLLNNGWAFMGQIAYRFSPYIDHKGIIGEGIEYNSLGYFFSAERNWNNTKRLSIITFGAPTMRGQSGAVTQEAYDLTGSINYNPYWGYQDGKVRNSRVVKSYDPTAIISFDWKIDDANTLKIAGGYHYSFYSNSALTFFNAPDPRPDYYRNLPSFLWDGQIVAASSKQLYDLWGENPTGNHYGYGNFIGADLNGQALGQGHIGADGTNLGPSIDINSYNALVELWQKRDNKTTQIDWDAIYAANYANNAMDATASARYIQERRHNDIQEGMANINYQNTQFDHLKITTGLELKQSQGIHFKTVDDLLGGNQWIDVDPFADRDIKELATNIEMTQSEINYVMQNDLQAWNKNGFQAKNAKQGDKFGYDYRVNMSTAKIWLQNEWNWQSVDFYYAAQFTYTNLMRSTNMINGRAVYLAALNPAEAERYLGIGNDYLRIQQGQCPDYLNGTWHHFVDPAVKIGANYKINGRNKLKINAIAQTIAPLGRDAYISPRVHDRAIENIYIHDNAKSLVDFYAASQKMVGGDLTYEFNYPFVRGRVTAFYSRFWNGTELNGYYDDEARTFVNQSVTGINRRHCGIEAAAAFKLGTYFTLTPALSVGDYRYTDNAYCVTSAENGMSLAQDIYNKPIYETRDSVMIKGLRVATGPQVNASLKLSFFHPKMWFADVTVSYFDHNFLDFAPSRRMKGLYTGQRADGTVVNGSYLTANAIEMDGNNQPVCDEYGTPKLVYPYNLMSDQESLSATNPLNRFIIDASIGKLIYLPNRQSLSINLNVTNLTNNTHFKTGGYQQARLPRATKQGETDKTANSVITANAWKFPSKYYYAWGTNFYLTITYKF
ncbi:MAG: carboxypeptidase-like regulatory domain-containing protein [Paludibacteraceae bacterium]|nr:carboxypeptidase-like regulatory domain-containing protein [Paludibacteraceae bacterium]